MKSKAIIQEQLAKIAPFIYILFFLFAVNIIFNLNYQWYGISLIVKVYLFLFSFYIVYTFSLIDITGFKSSFYQLYGKKGTYILFVKTRIVPVVIIYIAIIIYTLIDDIGQSFWPVTSLLEILSGRNSNIIFIAIILMVILKWKKPPSITIPIFVGLAVLHFIIYKSVYSFLPLGVPVTIIKFVEFFIFLFFLVYEFLANKRKFLKSSLVAMIIGVFMYGSLISVYSMVYYFSGKYSYHKITTSRMLLKLGYSFPLDGMKDIMVHTGRYDLIDDILFYSSNYNVDVDLDTQEWGDIFLSSSVKTGEKIIQYLMDKKINMSYSRMITYAEIKSVDDGAELIESINFIRYASQYAGEYIKDFTIRYERGNGYYKIWSMRVLSSTTDSRYIPFLVNELMGPDDTLVLEAYKNLKALSSLDPVIQLKINLNDVRVVTEFMKFYHQNNINQK